MSDFEIRLNCSCEDAARLTGETLARHCFKVVRTFDLRDAMRVQGTLCQCPYHGSETCTCNHIVLSVWQTTESGQPASPPTQILISSHQGDTWFSLPALAGSPVEFQERINSPGLLRGLAEVLHTAASA
ncbi:MAG: hypothetical protein FOGNACKC_03326 [Anaerolineae bacterium]|nr:hypothetical protein [Anaerolineae bacterium]